MILRNRTLSEKRSVLMKHLTLLVFVATAAYAMLDKYLGIEVENYVYLGFFIFAIINWLLIKYERIEISKVFGLTTFNIMVFMTTTSEPFTTGMHLHFVTAGAVALALYGYEQWIKATLFILFSLTLDVIAFMGDVSFIPWREVSLEQGRVFFILNTVIAAAVSVYTILLYSKMNYESEQALKDNEKVIRKQNEDLTKVNAELDRFVYSASHDLRSPLSTLVGLINLSKLEQDPKEQSKYLDLMNDRIKSMDSFISEIIDYSRNSRVEVKKESVNAKALLVAIADGLQFQTGKDCIEFCWEVPEDLTFITDISRLKIVMSNLISNAIEYYDPAKDRSWIKLKAEKVLDDIYILVEDNGLGIKDELKSKVFDMFYRAHEHSKGSGLGLYIVKETLSKLNGSISVESSEGVGCKFHVTLPVLIQ